jgi:hypothetical protein
LWMYPQSNESLVEHPLPPIPDGKDFYNTDLVADAQYIRVLDAVTGETLEWLYWQRDNDSAWKFLAFDVKNWAGRSIKINLGTYNNGADGFTVQYVDDVYFHICPPVAPPPPTCSERLYNNSFEYNSAWYIPATEYTAGYSTLGANSGWWSMRTGIYYPSQNRYSYSDFGQAVYIPYGISSAILSFYAYTISGEPYTSAVSPPPLAVDGKMILAPDSSDIQYLLVLNQWQYWIGTLLWQRVNHNYWEYYQYNVTAYQGQSIRLQWGTYNNGYSGVTSMFVDDASLQVCP